MEKGQRWRVVDSLGRWCLVLTRAVCFPGEAHHALRSRPKQPSLGLGLYVQRAAAEAFLTARSWCPLCRPLPCVTYSAILGRLWVLFGIGQRPMLHLKPERGVGQCLLKRCFTWELFLQPRLGEQSGAGDRGCFWNLFSNVQPGCADAAGVGLCARPLLFVLNAQLAERQRAVLVISCARLRPSFSHGRAVPAAVPCGVDAVWMLYGCYMSTRRAEQEQVLGAGVILIFIACGDHRQRVQLVKG